MNLNKRMLSKTCKFLIEGEGKKMLYLIKLNLFEKQKEGDEICKTRNGLVCIQPWRFVEYFNLFFKTIYEPKLAFKRE